jgi:putative ABC transport system permease protein
MVFSAERAQFSSIKAVSPDYPLKGTLLVSDKPFVNGVPSLHGPGEGEVWLESRLLPSLDMQVGDKIDVGTGSFIVSRVLIKEPDRGGGFNNVGPRVMMNLADVPATEVVQPGSRLTYSLLVAGDRDELDGFAEWLGPLLGQDYRLMGVKQGVEGIGSALDRAERFLLLGSLLGVILAGVAIALSAQRYSNRHYDHVAILRTLGAGSARIDFIYCVIFLTIAVVSIIIGSSLGWFLQYIVAHVLAPFIPVTLPDPGFKPYLVGAVTAFICLGAFALPPLLKLRAISPVRVIQRDLGPQSTGEKAGWSFGVAGTLGLMWWFSRDLELTLLLFAGSTFAVVVLGLASLLLLRTGRIVGMQAGSIWRLALAGMQRRSRENSLQILVFGLAIMLLLILILVRTALVEEWRAQIPEGAPNHFVINIAPDEVEPITGLISRYQFRSQPLYPMISGRIISVNGLDAKSLDKSRRASNEENRGPGASSNRNLTWSEELPEDNLILSGTWWPVDYEGEALVSIERDLAIANGLKVGDVLLFGIRDSELSARIASIRSVQWDNMKPNFYIIFSPGALEDFPSTYMTSFFLARDQKLFLNDLLRSYPTITVLEVDAIIEQIKTIIAQVTIAIELVLVLILTSGCLVLLASIQASLDERIQQQAILRTLGASQRLVMGSLLVEFAILGLFAGILATLGAEVTVFALETQLFELDYSVHPMLWVIGPVFGACLIGLAGILATRKVVQTAPINILRELS